MTDDDEIRLSTQSQPYLGGSGETRATLVVRCKERRKSVYIMWNEYLGHDDFDGGTKEVLIRLDASSPEKQSVVVSSDNESLGWWDSKQAEPIIRRLSKSNKLVARVTPYGESPREAEFNLAGLEDYLPKLDAACPRSSTVRSGDRT